MSMKPGTSTNNSRRTPSAVMMLFLLLSLMSRIIWTGTNKEHKWSDFSLYITASKWFLLKLVEPLPLSKKALRFTILQGTDTIIGILSNSSTSSCLHNKTNIDLKKLLSNRFHSPYTCKKVPGVYIDSLPLFCINRHWYRPVSLNVMSFTFRFVQFKFLFFEVVISTRSLLFIIWEQLESMVSITLCIHRAVRASEEL